MKLLRCLILLSFILTAGACNRSQPSGVPETAGGSPPPAPAPAPTPATAQSDPAPEPAQPVRELKAPPPLDSDIPPFAKTGFPDCDNYIEEYRQCLNSRLGADERKAAAHELTASMNAILGNIARGVEPSRIASRCKKSRRLAAPKMEGYGCILQSP
ncbi:hypothetical protein [Dokdonella sp.]|uniref:hypothetical protein n=1 Tax=Dokdonella sp. TaxID=2291710 RepID=UPI0035275315